MTLFTRISFMLLLVAGAFFLTIFHDEAKTDTSKKSAESEEKPISTAVVVSPNVSEKTMTVILDRIYLDGEVSEEIRTEPFISIGDILERYKNWKLVEMDDTEAVFQKKINDISPLLKANGYFGITDKGVLSIFKGKPEGKNAQIIQSFFQIDVHKLESGVQKELRHGIPIKTKEKYTKVIETFKPYSIEK
ncbi:BofC C-terminal domain-containing protein [Bacillus smithii]|uniref:BofC C-terminal domain-containing protein n=1 Tax=Bacillus smithii TaxID=1479 RepID=UPI00065E5795|nr:BofC C-terminal domain-containing protein [Bacillus smithii]AKP47955.1 forespore regulator of the sigma-K checkpoint [Bacillus smithii]MED4883441.1 BofC C-terminal domain-containing protein [Bacillus smithii]MED4927397.1 BofC C-terminal domain-containing protein [Bacillus smithii]